MTQYLPFELHCHTRHSDGQFTVRGLLESAAAYGYKGLALTDHNVASGILETRPGEEKLTVIPGIEWTTFYGHLLVLGSRRFVDWRFVTPDTIDLALTELKEVGGVIGVAHPWEVGAPLMCGCHWEFHVTRWDLVDYIEIWSNDDPHAHVKNVLALSWYDALLNQGWRLAVSAGRDWHGPDRPGDVPLLTVTYLGVEGPNTAENALDALRAGRSYITMGPTMEAVLLQNGRSLGLGETAEPGPAVVSVSVGEAKRRELWGRHCIRVETVCLVCGGRTTEERPYRGVPVEFTIVLKPGWLRLELRGQYGDGRTGLLGLTSPIYVKSI